MSYYNNPYYATNPSLNSLTSNTDITIPKPAANLGLRQIQGFEMVDNFKDAYGKTWKPYENYPMGIIDMEYNELRAAKTLEDKIENLYHLSVGCLNMWRHLKKNN